MSPVLRSFALAAGVLATVVSATSVHGFQIHPNKTPNDSRLANLAGLIERISHRASERLLGLFKSPVHEAIAQAAFGCTKDDPIDCAKETVAPAPVIWGVRWNDDPSFRMNTGRAACKYEQTIRANTQPICWYQLFTHAEQRAAAGEVFGPGQALLYRVHFGDLQFLHAMATADGEAAATTRAHILMWAEFSWGVATGSLRRDRFLGTLGIGEFGTYFPGEQSAAILFALGNPAFQNERVAEVALGSLLHLVQDSFSRSHVTRADPSTAYCEAMPTVRAPGAITQFHSYAKQNHSAHNRADGPDAVRGDVLEIAPSVVDVGRTIVQLWQRKTAWPEVREYFNCVFTLAPSARDAGPGEGYAR